MEKPKKVENTKSENCRKAAFLKSTKVEKMEKHQNRRFQKTQKVEKGKNTKIDILSKTQKHKKAKSPKIGNCRKVTFSGRSKNTKKVQKVTFLGFPLYLYIPPLNYLRAVASIFHENWKLSKSGGIQKLTFLGVKNKN